MKLLIGGSPCTSWSIARMGRETQPEGIEKAYTLMVAHERSVVNAIARNGKFPFNGAAEPVRIGTIESGTQTNHDSKPFRVYSPNGKAVTLQGEAGGYGAKTGLYAVPVNPSEFARGGCCLPYKFRCRRTNDSGNRGPRPRDL